MHRFVCTTAASGGPRSNIVLVSIDNKFTASSSHEFSFVVSYCHFTIYGCFSLPRTHTPIWWSFLGLPGWAGTRKVKPVILLKQETVSGSGISWAICKSTPHSRQITIPAPHHSVFYRPDALPAAQPTVSKHWRLLGFLVLPHTHTHTHPFNSSLCGTTRVSRYQKGKTNLDFTEARDSEWQWNPLGHMQVCTSFQTDNHASTSSLCFLQAGCPSCCPTNSVKALKAIVLPLFDKYFCSFTLLIGQ